MIRAGMRVYIRPEFADPGDNAFERIALEDESGARVLVATIVPGMTINPTRVECVECLTTEAPCIGCDGEARATGPELWCDACRNIARVDGIPSILEEKAK